MLNKPKERRRSGWLLLVVPLVATLSAGAWFGRSYLGGPGEVDQQTLAASGSQPASTSHPVTAASPTPSVPVTQAPVRLHEVDLGKVSGRYLLKGPRKVPSDSSVLFVVSGPKRVMHNDSVAPFSYTLNTTRLPNGRYKVNLTVTRPGLPALVQTQRMQIANQPKPRSTPKQTTPNPPGSGGSGGSDGSGRSGKGLTAQAAAVLKITNAERAKAGCKALSANSTLNNVAQAHSADMAAHNYFSHDSQNGKSPFDRMKDAGYNFRAAGENIAYGQRTATDVMNAWMNSPGHKANILNCTYTQIGIGYALQGSTPYWTQDFGTPL